MITIDVKDKLKLLLRDDVESFFEVIKGVKLNSNLLENEIFLLEAQYRKLNKSKRNGLISEEFASLRYNQIVYNGLEFIDKLSNDFVARQLKNEVNFVEVVKSNEEAYKKLQKEYFDFANHVLSNALAHYGVFIYEVAMSGYFELELILREISLAELDSFFNLKKLHKYLKKQRKKLLVKNELNALHGKFKMMDDYTPKSNGDRKMIFNAIEDFYLEMQNEKLLKYKEREFLKNHRVDKKSYLTYLHCSINFSKWRIQLFDKFINIMKEHTNESIEK